MDLQEARGYRKLKEEALDHTLSRTRFGRVRALGITQWDDDDHHHYDDDDDDDGADAE